MWCVADLTPEYIQKMEDVLAVYERPYDASEPVVCLDEKPVSLHRDVRPPTLAKPGKPAKRDNEYERCGTANVFGVVEPKAGRHFTTATSDRSGLRFARPLCQGSCRVQVIGVTPQGVPPGEKSRAESEGAHAVFLEGVQEIDGSQDVRSRWS